MTAAIPRTLASAKRLGYQALPLTDQDLTPDQVSASYNIQETASSRSHVVAIMPNRDDPNGALAKYPDGHGGYIYVPIPG